MQGNDFHLPKLILYHELNSRHFISNRFNLIPFCIKKLREIPVSKAPSINPPEYNKIKPTPKTNE